MTRLGLLCGLSALAILAATSTALPQAATNLPQTPAGTSAAVATPVQGVTGGVPVPVTSTAQPDLRANGTIASGTVGSAYTVATNATGTARFTISGLTASGATLQAQYSADGNTTWEAIAILRPPLAYGTTVTADGQYEVKASATTSLRLIVTVAGTGTVNVSSDLTNAQGLVGVVGPLPPGTAIIGKFGIDQTTPGTTNGVVVNGSALPTGAATNAAQAAVQSAPGTSAGMAQGVQGVTGGVPLPIQGGNGTAVKTDGSGVTQPTSTAAGANVAEGSPADAAYSGSGSASIVAALKGVYAALLAPTPAGSAIIGKVGIDQTTPGATNGVQVLASQLPTGAATAAGQAAQQGPVAPGTPSTASVLGAQVYNATAPAPASGQQLALQADATGNLKVNTVGAGGASAANQGSEVAALGAPTDAAYAGSGSASLVAALKGIYSSLLAPTPAGNNVIGSTTLRLAGTNRSTSVTTTAANLMANNTGRQGWKLKNDCTVGVWINFDATATAAAGSGNIFIAAGAYLASEPGYVETGAMSAIAASGTCALTAREY